MSCGDSCGGQCGGGDAVAWTIPDDAQWTALHVTGMHCGGCARRVERALAKVQGVQGVKVDLKAAKVEVATAAGVDARKLVSSTIDGLGYHVE
jgi:Cu+-exporting ATPase